MNHNTAPINNMDMTHLARLLLGVQAGKRHALASTIFANAERAANSPDVAVRNECGNGTISGAAQQYKEARMAPEPYFDDLEYLECWRIALTAAEWHMPARVTA